MAGHLAIILAYEEGVGIFVREHNRAAGTRIVRRYENAAAACGAR